MAGEGSDAAVREPPNHHSYGMVLFLASTLRYFIVALQFYESLLSEDVEAIKADPDLRLFMEDLEADEFPVLRELRAIKGIREWIAEKLPKEKYDSAHFPITHRTVRLLKSVSALYIRQLEAKRNAISARPHISKHALSAIDERISAFREKTETGIFKNATLVPLLVTDVAPPTPQPVPAAAIGLSNVSARPVLLDSIQILDTELSLRCMDLFGQFSESGQHDRLDTVITEATRILEDRLRELSGAAPTSVGVELATFALGGNDPRIALSSVKPEQEAAHLLFRGIFGFIRNQVHHRLVKDLSPERTLQIVGLVDYLLSLLEALPSRQPSDLRDNPAPS